MTEESGLYGGQLLRSVFDSLKNDLHGKDVILASQPMSEIADDSDYHKTNKGYTVYESAFSGRVDDKDWVIAFGTKGGQYPADPFDSDIAAFPIATNEKSDGEIAQEIHAELERGSYFYNSLIYAMADGRLAISRRNRFKQKVAEILGSCTENFIAQDLKVDSSLYTLDLRPVVKSAVRYKAEFVPYLTGIFHQVLAAS